MAKKKQSIMIVKLVTMKIALVTHWPMMTTVAYATGFVTAAIGIAIAIATAVAFTDADHADDKIIINHNLAPLGM